MIYGCMYESRKPSFRANKLRLHLFLFTGAKSTLFPISLLFATLLSIEFKIHERAKYAD